MALQNRVDPFGRLVAVPHRGTMMGNRGLLHDDRRRIVRTRAVDRWLCCELSFRGRHREVMAPRRYTELFFLDEATALAAGHRPCAECRHPAFTAFRHAWRDAGLSAEPPTAGEIDTRLAGERGGPEHPAEPLSGLPDGVLVRVDQDPHLWWGGRLHRWDWTGYHPAGPAPVPGAAPVLTPPSTVRAIRAGYPVGVHASARPRP